MAPIEISRGKCKVCCSAATNQDIANHILLYDGICGVCLIRKLREAEREITRLQATHKPHTFPPGAGSIVEGRQLYKQTMAEDREYERAHTPQRVSNEDHTCVDCGQPFEQHDCCGLCKERRIGRPPGM